VVYSRFQFFEDVSYSDMIVVYVDLVDLEDIPCASCLFTDQFSYGDRVIMRVISLISVTTFYIYLRV